MVSLLLTYLGFHVFSKPGKFFPSPTTSPQVSIHPELTLRLGSHTSPAITPRWGPVPPSERCAQKFRTATLLAFLVGSTGADQWFARHWVLATFKMLILFPSMLFTIVVGLMTSRSREGRSAAVLLVKSFLSLILFVWIVTDVVLWIVGGTYGIPGCGGGYGG